MTTTSSPAANVIFDNLLRENWEMLNNCIRKGYRDTIPEERKEKVSDLLVQWLGDDDSIETTLQAYRDYCGRSEFADTHGKVAILFASIVPVHVKNGVQATLYPNQIDMLKGVAELTSASPEEILDLFDNYRELGKDEQFRLLDRSSLTLEIDWRALFKRNRFTTMILSVFRVCRQHCIERSHAMAKLDKKRMTTDYVSQEMNRLSMRHILHTTNDVATTTFCNDTNDSWPQYVLTAILTSQLLLELVPKIKGDSMLTILLAFYALSCRHARKQWIQTELRLELYYKAEYAYRQHYWKPGNDDFFYTDIRNMVDQAMRVYYWQVTAVRRRRARSRRNKEYSQRHNTHQETAANNNNNQHDRKKNQNGAKQQPRQKQKLSNQQQEEEQCPPKQLVAEQTHMESSKEPQDSTACIGNNNRQGRDNNNSSPRKISMDCNNDASDYANQETANNSNQNEDSCHLNGTDTDPQQDEQQQCANQHDDEEEQGSLSDVEEKHVETRIKDGTAGNNRNQGNGIERMSDMMECDNAETAHANGNQDDSNDQDWIEQYLRREGIYQGIPEQFHLQDQLDAEDEQMEAREEENHFIQHHNNNNNNNNDNDSDNYAPDDDNNSVMDNGEDNSNRHQHYLVWEAYGADCASTDHNEDDDDSSSGSSSGSESL
ncbi:expressed unknown protein [Seminavis robusta]|uniref:Uncharacterized protein n=1 Tax=Seminavis robusta TaxID=568900 RepID=A0A9N8DVY6_9STRA|nr:expressed unknown protein [Seminavis robusta]|eukprot:Sro403_g135650.1 n/a (659) ;mRNA; f:28081-30057